MGSLSKYMNSAVKDSKIEPEYSDKMFLFKKAQFQFAIIYLILIN